MRRYKTLSCKVRPMEDETTITNPRALLQPQAPLVFLSYAREDKSKVKGIYNKLRNEQLNPWLDIADLLPGQPWEDVIIKTIRNARFVIVFLSNNSVTKRGYVQKEIKEALDVAEMMPAGEIYIVPVRLEPCPVPERLSKWQWIDIFERNGLRKIVKTLRQNLDPESDQSPGQHIEAQLIVLIDKKPEAMFKLRKVTCVIGRSTSGGSPAPDVNLKRFDPRHRVSRTHALISRFGNSFVLSDCGSTNGTIVNDKIILATNQTRILKSGDRLRLGDTLLQFVSRST